MPAVENPIVFAADLKIPVSLSPSKLSAGLLAPEPSSTNNGPVVSPAFLQVLNLPHLNYQHQNM